MSGHYRFRRSFGNVSSRFRGAIPKHFPLFTGILDEFGGASFAASLRLLNNDFQNEGIVGVRRASDSDIEFVKVDKSFAQPLITLNSPLVGSSATFGDFVSGTDGFVTDWIDQATIGGNDATQGDSTAQPKIVSSGSLIAGGIKFDGVNDSLDCGARILELSANDASIFSVSDSDGVGVSARGYICTEGDSLGPYSSNYIFGDPLGGSVMWVNTTEFGAALSASGDQLLATIYNGSTFQAYIDGATSGAAGAATVNAEATNTMIGASGDGITAFGARKVSELITYKSDQTSSAAGIFANINAHYAIY